VDGEVGVAEAAEVAEEGVKKIIGEQVKRLDDYQTFAGAAHAC